MVILLLCFLFSFFKVQFFFQLGELKSLCKKLHSQLCRDSTENEEWENKLGKQEQEMNELQAKVNDVRGRFIKPVLKKVSKR